MNKNTINRTSINVNDKRPPYDTGKIKIGVYYERPKPQQQSEEDLMWQSLLLGDRPQPAMPSMSSHRSVVYTLIGVGAYLVLSLIVH